ncbi:hypothetical protein RHMOL_Rhmol01G0175700 [Rhododendron molle]|uniref:Uncharacterized protein n=1 Tax=Rhododendron molle TaxID=49168 RepID=A0ACC0Q585_RHOML|nr:hypothetical protein RHMOL_Rhmol01G0175700 [Rhododendron molle]
MAILRVGKDAPVYEKNDAVHFSIKMHYDGKLVIGINTRRYVGGKVAFFDWVDTDYMGMIELKDMVKELNLFGSMTYQYKVPARDLYHGFRHLEDDSDCIEMVKWVKLSKTIEVYIENHCNFSNENQHLSTAIVISEVDGDGDGDGDVNQGDGDDDYTHSGDDTTDLEEFVDSEADESEDDRLFDINVDKNVEWGGLSMGKGKELMSTKANDNEDSDAEGQSDELGLIAACGEVAPYAEHRFCIRHFYNNFKELHKGLHLKELLFNAAKATHVARFNFHMEEMNAVDEGAVKWLADHPPMYWSRSHFRTLNKCDVLDNNRCESFNDTILDARSKTIIPMLEEIRFIMMERMQKRREKMREHTDVLCPNIKSRLNKRSDYASANCVAAWSGERIYQINCFSGEQVIVDLASHTCTCRKWDLTGFPCAHAIVAIEFNHENVDEYVAHWFTKQTYMASYEPIIYPMNGADMWPNTGVIGPLPPNVKKQAGRPKKLRKRGLDEPQIGTKLKRRNTTTTCAQCGMLGHNKRTCKGQPVTQKQGTTREKLPVRKKKSTTTKVQESASQPTIGTTRTNPSQLDMRTSGSQPQAAMGTTGAFNMRAQPQAATRTVPHPNSSQHFGGVMAKGKKSIKLSTLQQSSTKRA